MLPAPVWAVGHADDRNRMPDSGVATMHRRTFLNGAVAAVAGGWGVMQGNGRGERMLHAQRDSTASGQTHYAAAQFFEDTLFNYSFLTLLGAAYERLTDV